MLTVPLKSVQMFPYKETSIVVIIIALSFIIEIIEIPYIGNLSSKWELIAIIQYTSSNACVWICWYLQTVNQTLERSSESQT